MGQSLRAFSWVSLALVFWVGTGPTPYSNLYTPTAKPAKGLYVFHLPASSSLKEL